MECDVVDTVRALVVKSDQALRLAARRDCTDCEGVQRKAGEEWLVAREGAYLPGVDELYQTTVSGKVLTVDVAIQLKALKVRFNLLNPNCESDLRRSRTGLGGTVSAATSGW